MCSPAARLRGPRQSGGLRVLIRFGSSPHHRRRRLFPSSRNCERHQPLHAPRRAAAALGVGRARSDGARDARCHLALRRRHASRDDGLGAALRPRRADAAQRRLRAQTATRVPGRHRRHEPGPAGRQLRYRGLPLKACGLVRCDHRPALGTLPTLRRLARHPLRLEHATRRQPRPAARRLRHVLRRLPRALRRRPDAGRSCGPPCGHRH